MTNGKAKIRLLLVDDEVGYLEMLSKRLRKRNLDVTTANTGQQGHPAFAAQRFRRGRGRS